MQLAAPNAESPEPKAVVKTPRTRLDVALVERGLAPSRERARALVLAGQVTVDGHVVSKAGTPVAAGRAHRTACSRTTRTSAAAA